MKRNYRVKEEFFDGLKVAQILIIKLNRIYIINKKAYLYNLDGCQILLLAAAHRKDGLPSEGDGPHQS